MRGKSHIRLGRYLLEHYMPQLPKAYANAFLVGCLEPDRNPVTYLKGSLRCQWLRGHNYRNARRFMRKISQRLERKESFGFFDYYTLGKLIHYTTDAFTYAHNADFPETLAQHRIYEVNLQNHFLEFMETDPQVNPRLAGSVMEAIGRYHREYQSVERNIHTDSRFALTACCCVLAILVAKPIL